MAKVSQYKVEKVPMIIVIGPTSAGKTSFSLFLAKKFGAEIISADSRQVYKEIEIGTNKVLPRRKIIYRGEPCCLVPAGDEVSRQRQIQIPHFLIDNCSIEKGYSLGQFVQDTYRISQKIYADKKLPIIVGGTGQYINSLVKGWFGLNIDVSEEIKMYDSKSVEKLYAELNKADPNYAKKVDPNNKRRIARALAIFEKTGLPYSALQKERVNLWTDPLIIGLDWKREVLYARIDNEVEGRFKKGIVNEVEQLINSGISEQRIDDLGLSYRWALKLSRGDLTKAEAIEKAKNDEHAFVRRQMTWFRKIPGVFWAKCENVVK